MLFRSGRCWSFNHLTKSGFHLQSLQGIEETLAGEGHLDFAPMTLLPFCQA